jgi:hypothetical protein
MLNETETTAFGCPFCGCLTCGASYDGPTKENVQHAISWGEDLDGGFWQVDCSICGASGPRKKTREDAIGAWNDR